MKNMSGFATYAFLEFSKQSVSNPHTSGIACALDQKSSYSYFILNKSNLLFPKGAPFIVSPICLSGCIGIDFGKELENGELTTMDISGGFLQTRDDRETESGFLSSRHFDYFIDTRTNYRLNLGLDDETLLKSMKRDSRTRVRKIIKKASQFTLLKVTDNIEFYSNIFSELYSSTAIQARFDSQYIFDKDMWHKLFINPLWDLFILEYEGTVVAGAALSHLPNGYDYTFMGYKPGNIDASRALIYFIYKFLSKQNRGFLDLGGGINENDNLARFKLGLGAYETNFKRIRFVRRKNLGSAIRKDILLEHLSKRWP